MTKTKGIRRTSLQVALDAIAELKKLETLRDKLIKEREAQTNPISFATGLAIVRIGIQIAGIVIALRRRKKKK